ncbi:MAG: hypothetical protein GXO00_02120 [Candidatus Diapherotrites archaeon]|nr:hypothetical protein [Candidatus Diapherotrites archaeon]
METLTLKVKGISESSKQLLMTINNSEIDVSVLEELFLLLLSKKSKATEDDVEEIARLVEESAWRRIKGQQ